MTAVTQLHLRGTEHATAYLSVPGSSLGDVYSSVMYISTSDVLPWARGFVGGTEFPKVPVGPERPQTCNMRNM